MIREHDDLSIIFDHLTPNTMVIFDLDNTLFRNKHYLGSPEWFPYFQKQKTSMGLSEAEAAHETLSLYLQVNLLADVSLVDEKAPQIIRTLKKHAHVSALTARENKLVDTTCRQLEALDLKMTPWDHENLTLNSSTKGSLAHGMIFTGGAHKGHCLTEVLRHTGKKPERIIFVDDQEKSLHDVKNSLQGEKIEFVGIRYTKLDAYAAALCPKMCTLQLEHFQKYNTLLTNEETLSHLDSRVFQTF